MKRSTCIKCYRAHYNIKSKKCNKCLGRKKCLTMCCNKMVDKEWKYCFLCNKSFKIEENQIPKGVCLIED